MSAIFGYSLKTALKNETCMKSLSHWNKTYGKTGSDQFFFESFGNFNGIGAVLNHLSDVFPAGPAVIRTESYYAVIDAVLYNREELGQKLGLKTFNDYSDESLLFQWVTGKGFDHLCDVRGDFSGAVYSLEKGTFTLFRDHTGVRPLYFYKDASIFAFSTDLRGITAIPDTNTQLNEEIFFEKMEGHNELTIDKTDYQNITCVTPAHYITIKPTPSGFEEEKTQYWKLGSKKIRFSTDEEYEKEMCRLITEAIEVRAKAVSGIVGSELSGGLDSGVISSILGRTGHESCYYCWSYDPSVLSMKKVDERKVVLDICEMSNITCHFRQKDYNYTKHSFDYGLKNYDVPFLNTLMVSEGAGWMSDHGAKVVLCGYGGDEGVSHRPDLYELWYHHEYIAYLKATYRQRKDRSFPLLRTIIRTIPNLRDKKRELNAPFDLQKPSGEYLNQHFRTECTKKYPAKNFQFKYNPTQYILSGGPRVRMDVSAVLGMEVGVQYMFPYMDYKVIDFAVSIPRRLYTDGITDRLIYRNAFKHIIPKSLYEMNYKNMPSLIDPSKTQNTEPSKPDLDAICSYLKNRRDMIVPHLDRNYWKAYLDFEKIDRIGENKNISAKEYQDSCDVLNELVYCAYLQNVGTNIKEYNYES